ncbi:hypothetical protein VUR80DRAFT_5007 [Thermomyces stellatus]
MGSHDISSVSFSRITSFACSQSPISITPSPGRARITKSIASERLSDASMTSKVTDPGHPHAIWSVTCFGGERIMIVPLSDHP